MKARDQVRVDTLRSALSAFSYRKIEAGMELTDVEQSEVLRKLVKQRSDAIGEFTKAGRMELAAKETREREILGVYLPPAMTPEEIRRVVDAVIAELPAEARSKGPVMKAAIGRLRGKADGNAIGQAVEAALKA